MEPDSTTDSETGSPTPSGWWRRQTYDYCSYYLDGDGIIQKIYHDPDVEDSNAEVQCRRTRGRARTPPPQKGALKKTEIPSLAKEADRGSTPVSFKPQARPPKYFLRGNPRTSNITNESYGPTKLETNRFRSHDSEGETAWHSSQSPNDLDAPPPETTTPRLLGTVYVHRNTRDGGFQIWVWCNHEGRGQELWWRPVDLENEQFVHPKIATRSLKLTSTGKPSWVLNSTLTTYRTRSRRRSRSRPATGSSFTPEAESSKSYHLCTFEQAHTIFCHVMPCEVMARMIYTRLNEQHLTENSHSGQRRLRASNILTHSWRDDSDDRVIDSEDETIEYSSRSSEDSDTDRSILNEFQLQNPGSSSTPRPTTSDIDIDDLILGLATSASISSTSDSQILRKMDPASTPKPIICDIDSQLPDSMDNATIPSNPEALLGQMTTEPIISGIEDQIPAKASSFLTTNNNPAGSLTGHTMDNLDTCETNNLACPSMGSGHPSEGSGRPSEGSGRPSEGSGRPSEGSEGHSEGSGCPKLGPFQNIIDRLQLSQVLFKAGALIYLLFLIRVLQKIYAMFRSQPLTIAAGNLTFSIVLFILIQYHPPEQVQLRVVQKMVHIIGELVAY
ncbi:hypothetical protein C8J55DRAFT_487192 [Lentinula edodes]|uniref:Uncharacterized protein n=1 Tax=Lentinula lateritia TaxID=40482 RepID=A0A9W9ARM6_9AGAR|nr:hypothetical protein C8J55DRAFT_487192 [Lentinula edodes]